MGWWEEHLVYGRQARLEHECIERHLSEVTGIVAGMMTDVNEWMVAEENFEE